MKKKINIGLTIWLYIFIAATIGMIIFLICFALINKNLISTNELIKALIFTIVVAVICFPLMHEISAFIEISEDEIVLKRFFADKEVYKKNDIVISYAIQSHKGRGAYVCPCLVFGRWDYHIVCFTKKKLVYNNYFLVLLDYKKLQKILSWYNEEIKLPPKQEFEQFKPKNVKKFYEIIELHNYNIQQMNNER